MHTYTNQHKNAKVQGTPSKNLLFKTKLGWKYAEFWDWTLLPQGQPEAQPGFMQVLDYKHKHMLFSFAILPLPWFDDALQWACHSCPPQKSHTLPLSLLLDCIASSSILMRYDWNIGDQLVVTLPMNATIQNGTNLEILEPDDNDAFLIYQMQIASICAPHETNNSLISFDFTPCSWNFVCNEWYWMSNNIKIIQEKLVYCPSSSRTFSRGLKWRSRGPRHE